MTRLCAVAATATGRVGRFSIAFLLRSGGGARPWNGSTGWHARGHGHCLARRLTGQCGRVSGAVRRRPGYEFAPILSLGRIERRCRWFVDTPICDACCAGGSPPAAPPCRFDRLSLNKQLRRLGLAEHAIYTGFSE